MAKIAVRTTDEAPSTQTADGVETRALFERERDPIHVHVHRLAGAAAITLDAAPTDRVLYVWHGAVAAGGATLDTGSAMIVERGAELELAASAAGAELVSFACTGAACAGGGHLHLLPSDRVPRTTTTAGLNIGSALFADSRCPTCRVWLHETELREAGAPIEIHSHSEDEVIFVTAGSIKLGHSLRGPGTALFVAANTNYGFSSGADGLTFINFRPSSPTYSSADGSLVLNEADFFIEHVGKPQFLEAAH